MAKKVNLIKPDLTLSAPTNPWPFMKKAHPRKLICKATIWKENEICLDCLFRMQLEEFSQYFVNDWLFSPYPFQFIKNNVCLIIKWAFELVWLIFLFLQASSLRRREVILSRISIYIAFVFLFCHSVRVVPNAYELVTTYTKVIGDLSGVLPACCFVSVPRKVVQGGPTVFTTGNWSNVYAVWEMSC